MLCCTLRIILKSVRHILDFRTVGLTKKNLAGMHLLEMAKTTWNAIVTGHHGEESQFQDELRVYLTLSREILSIFGHEGDAAGPLDEIDTLHVLLESG
jgi:hypothetical protein